MTQPSTESVSPEALGLDQLPEFVQGRGDDGVLYTIRPFTWSIEAAERFFPIIRNFGIFSDDIEPTVDGFLRFIVGNHSLWFETINEKDENVGFIYLTDLLTSRTEKRILNATFHAVTWDAKAAPRRVIAEQFIRKIFQVLKLHRLTALIPMKFAGAIRTAKKIGFKDEGVLRSFRRYNGIWFNVLVLSILETEVNNG